MDTRLSFGQLSIIFKKLDEYKDFILNKGTLKMEEAIEIIELIEQLEKDGAVSQKYIKNLESVVWKNEGDTEFYRTELKKYRNPLKKENKKNGFIFKGYL